MIDFTNVIDIMLGQNQVTQIEDSLGNVLWSATPVVIPNYFYVEDISGSDNTLSIVGNTANVPATEIFKSTDGTNWTSMGTTSDTAITATIPANKKLYLKATTNALTTDWSNYVHTSTTGNYNIGGCITSLIFGDNFESGTITDSTNNFAFGCLFYNDTHLIDASNLTLPSSTATRCYQSMFSGCRNLVTPPSVIYGERVYTNQCEGMFKDCTSMTTAPVLPATTLAIDCYSGMFRGCTSLTTAPALPATRLVFECYKGMFNGCSSLNSITTYANNISASNCITNWLSGVAATGDFYNLGGATYQTDSVSGIPSGWTEHTSL